MTRIDPHLSHNQRRLIYHSFFTGHISYCPLIWTFCSRQSNHVINKLQEQILRIIYNDCVSSFELLEMSNESKIHIKNINVIMTEIYKFLNDLSLPIMNGIFQKQEKYYSLRNPMPLVSERKLTTTYSINITSFIRPQIWQDLPQDIKNSGSLNLFKSNVKRNLNLSLQDM